MVSRQCRCGRVVECHNFTNTCECGRDFNHAGQELAPRCCWGEETGEHWSECLGDDYAGPGANIYDHYDDDFDEDDFEDDGNFDK